VLRSPPRGSTMVFDDEHFALWERGRGSTNANLADGTKVTVFLSASRPLREIRPYCRGAALRGFYGDREKSTRSGPIYEENLEATSSSRRKKGPIRKRRGFGVLHQGGAGPKTLKRQPPASANLTNPPAPSGNAAQP